MKRKLSFLFLSALTIPFFMVSCSDDKEEQEVTKKRMFMFEGKKENNSSGGYGHLTVTENDGTEVEYEVVLNDVLKPADF